VGERVGSFLVYVMVLRVKNKKCCGKQGTSSTKLNDSINKTSRKRVRKDTKLYMCTCTSETKSVHKSVKVIASFRTREWRGYEHFRQPPSAHDTRTCSSESWIDSTSRLLEREPQRPAGKGTEWPCKTRTQSECGTSRWS